MNWVLVAFIFNLSANGQFDSPKILYRGFATEAACNSVGEHFREEFILPESTKSVSVCLGKAAFEASDWKMLDTPVADTPASSAPIKSHKTTS